MKNTEKITEYFSHPNFGGLELLSTKSRKSDFPFHTHDSLSITLVLKNTFYTKLQSKFLSAPVGTLSITNVNEVHATPCDHDLGNSFITYYVSTALLKYLYKDQQFFFNDRVIYDQPIFNALYSLYHDFDKDEIQFEQKFSVVLKSLILKYGFIKPIDDTKNRLFESFINETSFDNFSLEKTALQFGINKYKFIRLFKQETGLTPNHFVLLKKIKRSKEMLKKGASIFDVAIDCGFYDNSHFYKYFKKFTGVNPLDFQNAFVY